MTILEPDYLYAVPSALTIHQTRTMGLGILEDNGSGSDAMQEGAFSMLLMNVAHPGQLWTNSQISWYL